MENNGCPGVMKKISYNKSKALYMTCRLKYVDCLRSVVAVSGCYCILNLKRADYSKSGCSRWQKVDRGRQTAVTCWLCGILRCTEANIDNIGQILIRYNPDIWINQAKCKTLES